ncbi:aldo/keto reductase [Luteolibacter sp. AS25]|uniref:aldo/keto reductase n=1 Tax=Luteolibacter sp. AS25 TaxID=3135776 RepID=UPI00398AD83A
MEYRQLGNSGLRVPVLSFGTGTFAGKGPLFSHWGQTTVKEARSMIDICLEAGVNLFDSADVYSDGEAEIILGEAIKDIRSQVLIATKTSLPTGDGAMEAGSSRWRLLRAVEAQLKRLQTDHIDILMLHGFDHFTPVEEVLSTLDTLVRDGKVRYVGASNFAGWELMKSLGLSNQLKYPRHIVHQVYYSLLGRDYESELMPLAQDQGVGAMVWSPLAWGRLTGKIRRGQAYPKKSRLHETASFGPPVDDERLYSLMDILDEVAKETQKSIPQISINWLLQRPTVANVIIGARNENQLRDNLGAIGWKLSNDQIQRLDNISSQLPPYPYYPYHIQEGFARINPPLVRYKK